MTQATGFSLTYRPTLLLGDLQQPGEQILWSVSRPMCLDLKSKRIEEWKVYLVLIESVCEPEFWNQNERNAGS